MPRPNKYKIVYQTKHVEHNRTKIIFASSEQRALAKFRAYTEEYNLIISELDINKE